ncbi:MAG: signal recognition particle subunit SRP19/SEC65 family protein [Thermoplasmatota archaeon]
MPRRQRKTWIIYPEYFDKNKSRSDGRKVPIELAVKNPHIEEIGKVLSEMDVPNRIEKHAQHPANWYEENGRLIIPKQQEKKEEFLDILAEELKERH